MERYLKGKRFSLSCRKTTLDRLARNRFVDDREFAGMWVENRKRMNPRGAYALRQELLEKGVDESLIDENLDRFDETASALDAVRKKLGLDEASARGTAKKNLRLFEPERVFIRNDPRGHRAGMGDTKGRRRWNSILETWP